MTIFPSRHSQRSFVLIGVGVFSLTLLLYLVTSYPTVAYIDSGELATVNWTLGIAHPSGYPLYTMLGRLFALLPFDLIQTQNLFGSLATAAAVTILFLLGAAGSGKARLASVGATALAALTLAVSGLVWSQGTTNEVYSLHLLFVSLIFWLLFNPYSRRKLILGAFLVGLSFGNHLSTMLTAPAIGAYLFLNRRYLRKRLKDVLLALTALLTALSVYLYLPLRSAQEPLLNWGQPTNWDNFFRHVSGWQYRVWMFDRGSAELLQQLREFAVTLFEQFPLPFWPLIAAGVWFGLRRHRQISIYLTLVLLVNVVYALNFSIPDIINYLLPAVASLYLFAALAIGELCRKSKVMVMVVLLLVAASPPLGIAANWQRQDQSGNYAAADGVENFLRSCDGEALVLCANWDYVSPWLYLHFYEGRGEEVLILDPELARRSWYFDFVKRTDSLLYQYAEAEINSFLKQVRAFEADLPYNPQRIERAYQAVLQKLVQYPDRALYFDVSVQLGSAPPGEPKGSGQLVRLLREGESFTAPPGPFPAPRFGKPLDQLSLRERWHLDLHNSVGQ